MYKVMDWAGRGALGVAVAMGLAACGGDGGSAPPPPAAEVSYPATRAGDETTSHFGRQVADPYRWLEALHATPVTDWVRAQNAFSTAQVEGYASYAALAPRLDQLVNDMQRREHKAAQRPGQALVRQGLVQVGEQRQGRYYYQWQEMVRSSALPGLRANQAPSAGKGSAVDGRIYVADGVGQEGRVLVDVRALLARSASANDSDGLEDDIQLNGHQVSEDGHFLAYLVRRNFADLQELHLLDLRQPQQGPRVLTRTATNGFLWEDTLLLWTQVENLSAPATGSFAQQSLQRLDVAQPQAAAQTWYQGPVGYSLAPQFADQGAMYLERAGYQGNDLLRLPLNTPTPPQPVVVFDGRNQHSLRIAGIAPSSGRIWAVASEGAALRRLVSIDPAQPQPQNWQHLLPAQPQEVVDAIVVCQHTAYALQWEDGRTRLLRYDLERTPVQAQAIALPADTAVADQSMRCVEGEGGSSDLRYAVSSTVSPWQSYQYHHAQGQSVLLSSQEYPGYDPQQFEQLQLLVPGSDGVNIPITLARRKGLPRDGKAPTLMYTYGGFEVPLPALFDARYVPLLESGGIVVTAHVRGGAERGRAWYDAGRLWNKPRTYADLADVARYLVAQGYTSASRLGVQGESNGGTSSAALALRYPELLAVALPGVGVYDLTRFDQFTHGYSWRADYGDPTQADEFANLMEFSPLHNVRARTYPAIYVLTGDNDQRVPPLHSYKLAATLQNTATGSGPYLLHSFAKSGHGIEGEGVRVDAHRMAFFFQHTGTQYGRAQKP